MKKKVFKVDAINILMSNMYIACSNVVKLIQKNVNVNVNGFATVVAGISII